MPQAAYDMKSKARASEKPVQLDAGTASRVRRGFGLDPAELKISESPEVRAMGARAVAKGNVISFAPGEFTPGTPDGMEVLGHELAHVRSQAEGQVSMTGGVLEHPGHEAAADRAGEAFASGSLSAAGTVNAGALSGQNAPAQMKKPKRRKKSKFKPGQSIPAEKLDENRGLWDPRLENMLDEAILNRLPYEAPSLSLEQQRPVIDMFSQAALEDNRFGENTTAFAKKELGIDKVSGHASGWGRQMEGQMQFTGNEEADRSFNLNVVDSIGKTGTMIRSQPKGAPKVKLPPDLITKLGQVYGRAVGILNDYNAMSDEEIKDEVIHDYGKYKERCRRLHGLADVLNNVDDGSQEEVLRAAGWQGSLEEKKALSSRIYMVQLQAQKQAGAGTGVQHSALFKGLKAYHEAHAPGPEPAPEPEPEPAPFVPGEKITPSYMSAELPEGIDENEMSLDQRLKFARTTLEESKGNKEKSRRWAQIMAGLQAEQARVSAAPAPKKKKGNWFTNLFRSKKK